MKQLSGQSAWRVRSCSSAVVAVFGVTLLVVGSTGCTQQVHVRTQTPNANVIIDEQDLGRVDRDGIVTEIAPGVGSVPYALVKNGKRFEGEILRTETSWPLVIGAVGLAVCGVPACATASCLIANPTVFPALALGIVAGTGVGGFVAAIASPSWLSLPCLGLGAATGMGPLLLLPVAKKTPEYVVLGPKWRGKKGKKGKGKRKKRKRQATDAQAPAETSTEVESADSAESAPGEPDEQTNDLSDAVSDDAGVEANAAGEGGMAW